jgi:putative addiction module antidote
MVELKIVKIGNSLDVRLPREILNRMHVGDGDKLVLIEAPEGGYRLSPYDPEFERQMTLAEDGMRRYRNTLRELAKRASSPLDWKLEHQIIQEIP